MAFWAALPMLAGMASQASGSMQQAAATKEGAQTQAEIEAMNRKFQRGVYDADMARQRPYYDAGLRNLPQLQSATRYQNDPTATAPYRAQYDFGANALRGAGFGDSETLRYLSDNLTDAEREAGYNRLLDLEKIGLGASGAAGSGAQSYANALSSSLMTGGNAMAQGTQGANQIRQSAYQNALGQASSIPAWYATRQYRQPQPQYSNYGPYRDGYKWGE